jgi:hypothetical protein
MICAQRLDRVLGPAEELPFMWPSVDELRKAEKEQMSESPRDTHSVNVAPKNLRA